MAVRVRYVHRLVFSGALVGLVTLSAHAEVVAESAAGFVSEHELILDADAARAFHALTAEVDRWWNAAHSYSGKAENFSLDARAGGCFCERLDNGGSVEHMRVVFADPGRLLRLSGGLGPLQGMGATGSMDFAFTPIDATHTRLNYRYAVSGYAPGGLGPLAQPVDDVQKGQLQRLADYLRQQADTRQ
ncbi:MAG: hypothetical protein R3E82_19860 [Pseudomonadales bacterium]